MPQIRPGILEASHPLDFTFVRFSRTLCAVCEPHLPSLQTPLSGSLPDGMQQMVVLLFYDMLPIHQMRELERRQRTNLYHGTYRSWSTNADKIHAYMGFMILMGINWLPEITDYWFANEKLSYAPIADKISRDRFEEITRYLHFIDNDSLPFRGEDDYSKLQKVKPVISIPTAWLALIRP